MPFEATQLAFIQIDTITDLSEVNPCLLAKGTEDIISQLHVDHYEIIYLYEKALYHQETVEEWLNNYKILSPSSNVAQPPRFVFGEPDSFMALDPHRWVIGMIEMFAAMRKADEVILLGKNNDRLHTFIRNHPDYTYYKEGDKRYPDYKVTLYEDIADFPITWKSRRPGTDSVPSD